VGEVRLALDLARAEHTRMKRPRTAFRESID
jgi:hypothetical protein